MKLFVTGLPDHYDKAMLIRLFAPYGYVNFAKVGFDSIKMRSARKGTVEMQDEKQAEYAIKHLQGKNIGGNTPLHIKAMKQD